MLIQISQTEIRNRTALGVKKFDKLLNGSVLMFSEEYQVVF